MENIDAKAAADALSDAGLLAQPYRRTRGYIVRATVSSAQVSLRKPGVVGA
jgi:hypothetical protein